MWKSGAGDFPWCVRNGTAVQDGFVKVKFKPIRGREEQAGGIVCRWKDGNNYYVARANALESNVSLYYSEGGSRRTLKYVDAPVTANAWHVLRVEFKGTSIRVLFDGKGNRIRGRPYCRRWCSGRLDQGRQRDGLR